MEYRPDLDMDPVELNTTLPNSAGANAGSMPLMPIGGGSKGKNAVNSRDNLAQSGNARGRLGAEAQTNAAGAVGANSSDGPAAEAAAKKGECNFITQEVIDATIQCLITQADECEKNMLSTVQTEKMVMEELGRCLVEIIDFSIRNNGPKNYSHD